MVTTGDVRRVDFGYFVRPAAETGSGAPRVEPVLGYAVAHRSGLLLFDTGIGAGEPDLDAHYRPSRRALRAALAGVGASDRDVRWVVNCHLHFDHCGGNPDLVGRPVFVQRGELSQARTVEDYTLPHLVDFDGARYEEVDGEAEILPGVWVIPTPGHTGGHQSLAVRCVDGTVVLAGQAHDSATAYTGDQLAWRAHNDAVAGPLPQHRPWIERLECLDPARILFAHDQAVWEPASSRWSARGA
ncbi:MAG: MBL fold metallo-hydrolase [Carbonactinosporaceae bacterium]